MAGNTVWVFVIIVLGLAEFAVIFCLGNKIDRLFQRLFKKNKFASNTVVTGSTYPLIILSVIGIVLLIIGCVRWIWF
jgi:hypothetical protein